MRFELYVGGILAVGLSLTAAACGSSESGSTNPGDGNPGETNASSSGGSSSGSSGASSSGDPSSSSGGSSSGGSSSGALTAKELAKGFVTITGIAGDQVVFQAIDQNGITLNAVPIAGGTATKIADMAQGDRALVRGGAVGLWKTVTTGIGTFNVWTKAAGLKAGPANSLVGLFTATEDGSRVAFSVAATADSSRLAIVDPATVTASTTYAATGASAAINVVNTCSPFLRFAGKTFVAAYCTAGNGVRARLVAAADGQTALTSLVSNSTNANGIQPYFQLSKDNTKVMVLGLPDTETGVTADEQLRIVTLAGGAVQIVDTDVYDGVLNDDGSQVVYQTGAGALKRASTGATPNPVEIVAPGTIKGVEAYSSDRARVLFASTDPDPESGAVDLKTATTAAANTPTDVAAGVQSIGFNAAESHFLYVKPSATGASFFVKPVAGGAEKDIFTDPEIALVPPSGAGVLVGHDSKEATLGSEKIPVFSLTHVDMAGTKKLVATDVPVDEWAFKDKAVVYARLIVSGTGPGAGSGLYVVTLP
jgi:hypothetical protein